MRDNGTFLRL